MQNSSPCNLSHCWIKLITNNGIWQWSQTASCNEISCMLCLQCLLTSLFLTSMSHSASAKMEQASFTPQCAAACSGVQPSLSWTFKLNPAWIKSLRREATLIPAHSRTTSVFSPERNLCKRWVKHSTWHGKDTWYFKFGGGSTEKQGHVLQGDSAGRTARQQAETLLTAITSC